MRTMKAFVLLCVAISIINASRIQLSSSKSVLWTFANENGTVTGNATVPGGVYSDLQNASIIGDILWDNNDVLTRWVTYETWTYTASFKVTEDQLKAQVVQIVFEGLDTIAFVELNDSPIGTSNNMFVRYVYDIKNSVKVGTNVLKVTFISPTKAASARSAKYFTEPNCVPPEYNGECHANQLRKMQASFSWDWGPAFPSVGIWKPVYIEAYSGAIIRSLTTHTNKTGSTYFLTVRAYLETGLKSANILGVLSVSLKMEARQVMKKWLAFNVTSKIDGTADLDMLLPVSENMIRLWWPNGYGEQPLYDLVVQLNMGDKIVSHKNVQVGFRTIKLIENPASTVLHNDSVAAKGLTFYFLVNDYPIFMKGSNWIPANILPELGEQQKYVVDNLLHAARDAHMNMLRVWGGGVYESDYFYEKCDQLGILIWQDLMFACSMYPVDSEFLQTVAEEIEQNVIRLQYHPSIALWAGNNENEVALRGNWYNTAGAFNKYKKEYIELYVKTIKPIVEDLDPWRRYLVSSPSNGLESEKEGYIAVNPYDAHYGDTHYYNYMADSWNINTYPNTRFASEYGFQSLPSLVTMRTATNNSEDFRLSSSYSEHRQHSPNGYHYITSQIDEHLNLKDDDPEYFEKYIFYSQISQAMSIKTETEFYRLSQAEWYTMGALYWQLNDVWQAPSWSGIEYGGKWKMLHYFAKNFFAPVLIAPRLRLDGKVSVYLINDRFVPIDNGEIVVHLFHWNSLVPISNKTFKANVDKLSAKAQDIDIDFWNSHHKDEVFLRFSLNAAGVTSSPYNFVFPVPLKFIKGLTRPIIDIAVSSYVLRAPDHKLEYTIEVNVDAIVLFLWFDTDIEGVFDSNGIIVTEPKLKVTFMSKTYVAPKKLESSIKYKYYMH